MRFRRAPAPARRAHIATARTASAQPADATNTRRLRRLSQQWQQQALGFYDTVGECWYPAQFYARAFPRIRFYPAILNDRGEPVEVEDGPLVEAFDRIRDPGGSGHTELTASYGKLQWLIGDGYLVVSEQDGEEAWEYLSPLELRVKPEGRTGAPQEYSRISAPGIEPENLVAASDDDFEPVGNEANVYRMWRRHPAYSQWADSPVKGVLELYALLSRLTLAAGAESMSRAANHGAFYLPEELNLAPLDAERGGDEDPDLDIFLARFIEAVNAAIANPGSADAMSPIIIRGPAAISLPDGKTMAMKDAMGHIPIGPERDYTESEMWTRTIERISYGLDMPREYVTGIGGANHWTGWILDDQAFRLHIAPIVERFCADMTTAYLRPWARDENLADSDRVTIWYDPADAINHPDEIKTAQEGWDRGVVSDAYLLDKMGANESDAPSPEEREQRLLWLSGKPEPDETGEPEGETSPVDGGRGGDTLEQAPDPENAVAQNGNGTVAGALALQIVAAAESAVDRARDLAGNRLISRAKGCEPCQAKIKDLRPAADAALVASTLGPEDVRDIIFGYTTEAGLVAGAGRSLSRTLARRYGVADEFADELGRITEQHAMKTIYEPSAPPLPSSFAAVVAAVVARATR